MYETINIFVYAVDLFKIPAKLLADTTYVKYAMARINCLAK